MSKQYNFHIKVVGGKYVYYTLRYKIREKNEEGLPTSVVLIGKTKEDIYRKIDEIEGRGRNKNMRENLPLTLDELTDYYLENMIKSARCLNTYNGYKGYQKAYFQPFFGVGKLSDITPLKVQQFVNYLIEDRGLSHNYVRGVFAFLRSVLDIATNSGVYYSNPAKSGIKLPKKTIRKATPFTEEEFRKFINYAKDHSKYYEIYLACFYLGTRRGEILGLSWQDYDEIENTIRIHQQVQDNPSPEGDRVILTKHTKNYSDRENDVPEDCMKIFRKIRAEQIQKQKSGTYQNINNLIFTNEKGGMISPNCVSREFREICKVLNLKHRFHDLRHTTATIVYEASGDLLSAQHAIGDADLRSVAIYVKRSPRIQRENAIATSNFVSSAVGLTYM